MQLTKTTNQIDIKNIIDLGLFDSKSANHIQLAKHMGSKYLDFTPEECTWMDKFWDAAYNNSWLLVTKEMIVEEFGYKDGEDAYTDFHSKKLRKKFEKDIDYKEIDSNHHLVNFCPELIPGKNEDNRGGSNKKHYIITGETFKTCCMMAHTETGTKTRKYFLKMERLAKFTTNVLFECIKYQMEIKMKEKELIINHKDDKIDDLSKKIDLQTLQITDQNRKIDDQTEQIRLLLLKADNVIEMNKDMKVDLDLTKDMLSESNNKLDDTNIKLEDTNIKLAETNDKLTETNIKLGIAVKTRVVEAKDNNKTEQFVMIVNPAGSKYQFYAMRRQKQTIGTHIKKYLSENPKSELFLKIDEQPNSRNLFYRVKEELKSYIECSGNNLSIRDNKMTKEEFKQAIIKLHEKRLDV